MATVLDGWFRHDWWESRYFSPIWFAPADEEGQEGLRPEFYGGRGGRPLLRYKPPKQEQHRHDDDLAQQVREQWEWLEWLRRREIEQEIAQSEEKALGDLIEAAKDAPPSVDAPPDAANHAPLRPLAYPFKAPVPIAMEQVESVAKPDKTNLKPPQDSEFDYRALMSEIDAAIADVDTSMATFDFEGLLGGVPLSINL